MKVIFLYWIFLIMSEVIIQPKKNEILRVILTFKMVI